MRVRERKKQREIKRGNERENTQSFIVVFSVADEREEV